MGVEPCIHCTYTHRKFQIKIKEAVVLNDDW